MEALQHVLRLPNSVRLSHKKHLLRHAIWLFTTADGRNSTHGKMNIRYVSDGVLKGGSDIRHEHIVPIRELINQLLEEPGRCRDILKCAEVCLVTHGEHTALGVAEKKSPKPKGRERYRAAGIQVFDRKSNRPADWS